MADGRMEEILTRLEALESRHEGGGPQRGPGPPPPPPESSDPVGPPGLGVGFDEKRVVDLIVGLVVDQVDHLLERKLAGVQIDEEQFSKTIARVVDERLDHAIFRMSERLADAGVEPFVKMKKKGKKKKG